MEEAAGWNLTPFEEAISKLDRMKSKPLDYETIPTREAIGRILAEDIVAERNVPDANLAFMDGYAIRAEDVQNASPEKPATLKVVGKIYAGEATTIEISAGQTAKITHYAVMPSGATAIVPIEAIKVQEDILTVKNPTREGMAILPAGADIKKGSLLLKKGHVMRPQDLALLSDLKRPEVGVIKKPRVMVLSVGGDMVKMTEKSIIEDESGMAMLISKLLYDVGSIPISETVPDDVEALKEKFLSASQKVDIIITIGGLSVGEEDLVPQALESVGQLIMRGVAILPPWLTTFGTIKGKPIVCLPARYVPLIGTFYCFAMPLLSTLSGISTGTLLPTVKAKLSGDRGAPPGKYFFLTVNVKEAEGQFVAKPVFRGPHPISSLVEANGFIIIPAGKRIHDGEEVKVSLFSRIELANLLAT
ncbi:MAG: molybdopterin molybdotransferase MoeA [Candidatus Bathyarchaeota archaeon]